MGAVMEGFEAARLKHDRELEDRRQREKLVDEELHALARLLDKDSTLLAKHGITHEFAGRALRVNHGRSPILTIHFNAADKQFQLTAMKDGAHSVWSTEDACAGAIGGHIFDLTS